MYINCKIKSANFLLYRKLEKFINQTPFFVLKEGKTRDYDVKIIFWDIDSVNIDNRYFNEIKDQDFMIIIISSIFSKCLLSTLFDNNHFIKIRFMKTQITYSQFIEEISAIIDS
jgi:hypothetical protein